MNEAELKAIADYLEAPGLHTIKRSDAVALLEHVRALRAALREARIEVLICHQQIPLPSTANLLARIDALTGSNVTPVQMVPIVEDVR